MNLIFTNCLEYNGRESEYTRYAQSLERGFLRAFQKNFPRTAEALQDSPRLQREMDLCVQKLGALDKTINKVRINELNHVVEQGSGTIFRTYVS